MNIRTVYRPKRDVAYTFAPALEIEKYEYRVPKIYGWISLGMVVAALAIIAAFIFAFWTALNQIQASETPTVSTFDPCALQVVYCPGESVPVVGIASFLEYHRFDTCAARDWPKGTALQVSANGRAITCVVRDYGPDASVHPDRIVDLNRTQFAQLASTRTGLVEVKVEAL